MCHWATASKTNIVAWNLVSLIKIETGPVNYQLFCGFSSVKPVQHYVKVSELLSFKWEFKYFILICWIQFRDMYRLWNSMTLACTPVILINDAVIEQDLFWPHLTQIFELSLRGHYLNQLKNSQLTLNVIIILFWQLKKYVFETLKGLKMFCVLQWWAISLFLFCFCKQKDPINFVSLFKNLLFDG